jgi:hypothetical protein
VAVAQKAHIAILGGGEKSKSAGCEREAEGDWRRHKPGRAKRQTLPAVAAVIGAMILGAVILYAVFPPPWSGDHSPSTRRVCSIRISSAMLVRDSRTSGAGLRSIRPDLESSRWE